MALVVESFSSAVLADVANDSYSLAAPTGTASGDLLLLWVGAGANRTIASTPSGWTAITSSFDGSAQRMYAYYMVADGTDGPWTISLSLGYNRSVSICARISGADTSAVVSSSAASGSWTTILGKGLTTTANDSIIFYGAFANDTIAKPTDTTLLSQIAPGAPNYGQTVAYKSVATAGAVADNNFGTAINLWAEVSVAFTPASGGGGSSFYPFLHQPQTWQFVGRK